MAPPTIPAAACTTASCHKVALIMGVANQRSIAWAVTQSFLRKGYDCLITVQSDRILPKLFALTADHPNVLASLSCNVETDLPLLFKSTHS